MISVKTSVMRAPPTLRRDNRDRPDWGPRQGAGRPDPTICRSIGRHRPSEYAGCPTGARPSPPPLRHVPQRLDRVAHQGHLLYQAVDGPRAPYDRYHENEQDNAIVGPPTRKRNAERK